MQKILLFLLFLLFPMAIFSQVFTKQDSLRGSNNNYRNWWDVQKYTLNIFPKYDEKSIIGYSSIEIIPLSIPKKKILQIDLQEPMKIDKIYYNLKTIISPTQIKREGNVYFIDLGEITDIAVNKSFNLRLDFSGKPREAVNAPWDGGWVWKKDSRGKPWMSVACEGIGASVWYPCKDYLGDEPDKGMELHIETTNSSSVAVGNGNLISKSSLFASEKENYTYSWEVKNPINNYNIIPYIGNYKNFIIPFEGVNGKLNVNCYVLEENFDKAKTHFIQSIHMLKCFEDWFGPYPFYKDGFKLVEAPYLGMEHQSNIAYGNQYKNGYLGNDLSGTGHGLKWDFIIIHEAGHEWFGNSITVKDIADLWVHEGFTNYSEVLYTECQAGKQAGDEYAVGLWKNIENDKPIIGKYGVNNEGSGDMYYKASGMIHTLRQIINDDNKFKIILREMNKKFYHQTVTTQQIEDFLIAQTKLDLKGFFNQYLRTTHIPVLEVIVKKNKVSYRWANTVSGFNIPIRLKNSNQWITPTEKWQTLQLEKNQTFEIDPNFLIQVKE